ncbi:hypothetical protein pdam_00023637 [Pocillopora damicornis]|uniref:Uncharacterized protein n=1 Tax=Pocillopora damicornis TaxID=46731 RepID=A0A3M6TUJ4_POCDA|nr:hypothetical protein pdam_00023637 [Pocillopora damicornis]
MTTAPMYSSLILLSAIVSDQTQFLLLINFVLLSLQPIIIKTIGKTLMKQVMLNQKSVFEPDADAVTEAQENLRNNQGNIIYSFNPINDQENSDLPIETQNLQDTLPE